MDITEIRWRNFMIELAAREGDLKRLALDCGEDDSNYFSQIKNRTRNIGSLKARGIEAALGRPHGWMDKLSADGDAGDDAPTARRDEAADLDGPLNDEVEAAPYRNPVGAGPGELRENDERMRPRRIPRAWLPPGFRGPLVIAWVKGTSMEPEIPDGAPIIIDTGTTRFTSGMVYAFHADDGPVIKKVVRKGPMWQAQSVNAVAGRTWFVTEPPIVIGWVLRHLQGKL